MKTKRFEEGLFFMAVSGSLLLLVAFTAVSAWGQELYWANQAAVMDSDYTEGQGVAVDGAGNTYAIGTFSGTAIFGVGEANETVLTSAAGFDIFVTKYGRDGSLLWARRAGSGTGFLDDFGSGIAVDRAGNSYVTGYFSGTATFGAGEVNETVLTSANTAEFFVARYDSDGSLTWVKQAFGSTDDYGVDIAVDGSGNCFVTGFFYGTATFGAGEASETVLTSAGTGDIFIAMYDRDGSLLWARHAGGTGVPAGDGIAVDGAGSCYVTGTFLGTATFGFGEANETVLSSNGGGDIFVAKYDRSGGLLWATKAGGAGLDGSRGIAVDGAGNSYATGYFSGDATFGSGEANQTDLSSTGSYDIFVAKYDRSGSLLWATQAGGNANLGDFGVSIAVDGPGSSYVTGYFSGDATFGVGEPEQTILNSAGGFDVFVAKFDRNGSLLWAVQSVGAADNRGYGIAVDGPGNSYVAGSFTGDATFGAGEANQTVLSTDGIAAPFVAKFTGPTDKTAGH